MGADKRHGKKAASLRRNLTTLPAAPALPGFLVLSATANVVMPANAGIQSGRAQGSSNAPLRGFGMLVHAETLDPRVRGDDAAGQEPGYISLSGARLGVTRLYGISH